MMELTIHGRGGQGGVTLAKLLATAYHRRGLHAQAFGLYAAERSGAPIQAFVRIDEHEITNHNLIRTPDHVVILDHGLVSAAVLNGLNRDGWIIVNHADAPDTALFAGRRVAWVGATAIAVEQGLGTRSVPIVNTTMFGAVARVLKLEWRDVEGALRELKFSDSNVTAARRAFEMVQSQLRPGDVIEAPASPTARTTSILDKDTGLLPRIRTGAWATHRPQRNELTPPCNHVCPAGNDVRGFVAATANGDYTAALRTLLLTSPLPGVCGRVCPAPCMDACNRAGFDEAINVRELERYAADHGDRPAPTKPWRDEKVAVVGSGPAGLSAAYHLARLGYEVTVFEGQDEPGGVLRNGIPEYRLPRDVLDEEIDFIRGHGVNVQCRAFVDRAGLLNLTNRYDAVFIATGLQEARAMELGAAAGESVLQGIDFLDRVHRRTIRLDGRRVAVIGGGNTAIDAARSAKRVGAAHVSIFYRRTRGEMPAIAEEIDAAIEEGVELHELVLPQRLHRDGGRLELTCTRMMLGEPDESGRARPVELTSEDAHFDVSCDLVILALGQSADLSILSEGAEIRDAGKLLGLAAAPIYIGGDLATNEGTVAAAIGSGRKAALHVHETLSGENLFPSEPAPVATADVIHVEAFSPAPRERGLTLPPRERHMSFHEVHRGLLDEPGHHPARLEAQRCFSCGVCNDCDRCRQWCPEGILTRNGDGYRFNYDYCKGCGVCASQCPRGVIRMNELP